MSKDATHKKIHINGKGHNELINFNVELKGHDGNFLCKN